VWAFQFCAALEWAWQIVFWQIDKIYKTNKTMRKYIQFKKNQNIFQKCGRGSFMRHVGIKVGRGQQTCAAEKLALRLCV